MKLWVFEIILALSALVLALSGRGDLALGALAFMALLALAAPVLGALLGDADPGEEPAPPRSGPKLSPEAARALAEIDAQVDAQRRAILVTPEPRKALARALEARDPEALRQHREGLSAERAGDWARAEACYARVVAAFADWVEPWHGLLRAVYQQGEAARAAALCPMMQGRSPNPMSPMGQEAFLAWSEDERAAHNAQLQAVLESQLRIYAVAQLEASRAQLLRSQGVSSEPGRPLRSRGSHQSATIK